LFLAVLCFGGMALAVVNVPPPEFDSGYKLPDTEVPEGRGNLYEYMDVAVLVIALGLSSYLALRRRSRRGIFVLMVLSLLYFGFYRKGCVCPIGAIGNVTLAVFDSSYVIPLSALAFFVLPLVFTLFFGRGFCGGVCPLGAIQDIVLLRPVKVPGAVESCLRLLAYVYLGAAILFAATGSAFLICRYDPFVGFFRLSGDINIIILGVCFLVIGVFVGRPYCRFLCPYGVILRQLSRLSKWKVTITPDECIKCNLCEDACPFGAIKGPMVEWPGEDHVKGRRKLGVLIALLPVIVAVGAFAGAAMSKSASRMHPMVRLADRIYLENAGEAEDTTDASLAFRATGRPVEELYAEATSIQGSFRVGGYFFGGFVGLIAGIKLILLSIRWSRSEYEASRAGCIACGRCFSYCPREHVRLGLIGSKEAGDEE